MMYVTDEPNLLDAFDVFNEIDVFDVPDDDDASYTINVSDVLDESDIFTVTDDLDITNIVETTDIDSVINDTKVSDVKIVVVDVPDVLNVTDITDVTNISDDSYGISSPSDIPQVTATREVLKVHHQVDMEYDANGPPVLPPGLTSCPSRPPKKPPYSKQCGNTNLHGMDPYESLQAHVHEVEPMVVSDDDSTDDLNHDDDDASYELDPFNIDTPVVNIQAIASKVTTCLGMSEKVHIPKDKWFGLSQKTKQLWDQIDDNDKLVILGYTKSYSPSSSSSRPPGKPPFPPKQCCSINLHEMSTYEFLKVHTH
jgi:hypothetical protein